MQGMTRLDAAMLALGVAVMDSWDRMPEGGTMQIRKVEGEPHGAVFVASLIRQVLELETGVLHNDGTQQDLPTEAT